MLCRAKPWRRRWHLTRDLAQNNLRTINPPVSRIPGTSHANGTSCERVTVTSPSNRWHQTAGYLNPASQTHWQSDRKTNIRPNYEPWIELKLLNESESSQSIRVTDRATVICQSPTICPQLDHCLKVHQNGSHKCKCVTNLLCNDQPDLRSL